MTHRRAILVALVVAVLFAAGYSLLAPQDARGWGSIEIVDVSPGERDERGVPIYFTLRFPGARFGVLFRFGVEVTSAQCGVKGTGESGLRRQYWQGDLVEKLVLPACAADDYELTAVLFGNRGIEIARDTMRFSVPSSP